MDFWYRSLIKCRTLGIVVRINLKFIVRLFVMMSVNRGLSIAYNSVSTYTFPLSSCVLTVTTAAPPHTSRNTLRKWMVC